MKVAVSGATGFLGGELARTLSMEGHKVSGFGSRTCPLSNKEKLLEICRGQEAFVHCAALSSPWGRYRDFYETNVIGTRHVVEACVQSGVKRLIHISTPSLYVEKKNKSQVKEEDVLPQRKINHYAATKFLAEEVVKSAKDNIEVLILRPQAIVGAGDRSIFPRILRLGRKGVLPVIGDGKNKIDMTCVENVVEAIKGALTAPKEAVGEVYNITNDEPVELYPTLKFVFKELGLKYKERHLSFETAYSLGRIFEALYFPFPSREPLLTRYSACVLGRERTLNIDKAKSKLGYAPKISLQEGLKNFLKGLKA